MDPINQNNSEMTSIDIVDDNLNDIKNNLEENQNDETNIINCLKLIFVSILILVNFPIIFCDLYYAVNDNTCVNQKMDKLAVNMYDYLIVSGIYSVIITIILILFILFFIDKMKNNEITTLNYVFMLFLYINGLFNISWNIIGSIIFWKYMDNNQCSNEVFNYLFASLIIKLVFCSTILLNNKKKN
jgi:chromate transport protein ChrA